MSSTLKAWAAQPDKSESTSCSGSPCSALNFVMEKSFPLMTRSTLSQLFLALFVVGVWDLVGAAGWPILSMMIFRLSQLVFFKKASWKKLSLSLIFSVVQPRISPI